MNFCSKTENGYTVENLKARGQPGFAGSRHGGGRGFWSHALAHAVEAFMTAQMDTVAYDSGETIPYVDSRIYTDAGIFEE